MKSKSYIELNGQLYDTTTGKLVTPATTAKQATAAPKKKTKPVQHIDGLVRKPQKATTRTTQPNTVSHRNAQKSTTLMRSAVKKPSTPAKLHTKSKQITSNDKNKITASPKNSLFSLKPGRAIRAKQNSQSSLISKFGKTTTIRPEALAVKEAPKPSDVAPPIKAYKNTTASPVSHASPKKLSANHQSRDVFQEALDKLADPKIVHPKKPSISQRVSRKLHVSPRVVNFAVLAIVAVLVSTFVAYQNIPGVAMRIAATRAGFSASLPSYKPAGYAMNGHIKYQPGEIKVNYKSNSNNREFSVVQKNTSWNSESLLENYIASSGFNYQTIQSNGRTIYVYDGNKATWVDGGVWYNIDGQSNLNSDQLLRIAKSL